MNYAVVVGISEYHILTSLDGVANDVREISKVLASNDAGYSLTVLANHDAHKAAIQKHLTQCFSNVETEDTVIVFLAGHGGIQDNQAYFCPSDYTGNKESAVSLEWLRTQFEALTCKRVLFLLDFCHSGGAVARSASSALARAVDIHGVGKIIISACSVDESSHEDPKSGHGWFTKAVLEGLQGEAADETGWITITSLYSYVCKSVGAQGLKFKENQSPQMHGQLDGEVRLVYNPRMSPPKSESSPARKVGPPRMPKLKRANFDPIDAAQQLFSDLDELVMSQQQNLLQLGVRLTKLPSEANQKVYVFKLSGGKTFSLALAIGPPWGYESVTLSFEWNSRGPSQFRPGSMNDSFRLSQVAGEDEDYVSAQLGAVKDADNVPRSQFLERFWEFVCGKLEQLDG